jgi:hypothetical protein
MSDLFRFLRRKLMGMTGMKAMTKTAMAGMKQ